MAARIDLDAFSQVWERLCKRFGRAIDHDEAIAYLEYLEGAGLTTDQVVAAGVACWATREFFPRPADFLQPQAAAGWEQLLEAQRLSRPHGPVEPFVAHWATVPQRVKDAIGAIGGLGVIAESRDLLRTRSAYFDAFERVVIARAAAAALPPAREHVGTLGAVGPLELAALPSSAAIGVEIARRAGPQRVEIVLP